MKKFWIITLLFWVQGVIAQNEKHSKLKPGGLKIRFLNEKREGYAYLEGQLILNEKAREFKADTEGYLWIRNLDPGKYSIKVKTKTCCTLEITEFPIHTDKITYSYWQIPAKSNLNDTCVKREKYAVPKIEPTTTGPCTISREEWEKMKAKSIQESLKQKKK
ncbi:MAG: hypothetical protein ACXVPN_09570 [Bacteroidia bacterium]